MKRKNLRIDLLVCDLDNTLYNWSEYFIPAFYEMLDEVMTITGLDEESLLRDFREVHKKYEDLEHPFALLETESIKEFYKNEDINFIAKKLDSAFHRFNRIRKAHLKLFPEVRETLDFIKGKNVRIIAFTESKTFSVIDRLGRLNLFDFFDRIYCRESSKSSRPNSVRYSLDDKYNLEKIVELPIGSAKPDPDTLLRICSEENVSPSSVAYVGDSMSRDVLMAREAGVYAVFAKYGAKASLMNFDRLIRISHWNDEQIHQARYLARVSENIVPDLVLRDSFSEMKRIFA